MVPCAPSRCQWAPPTQAQISDFQQWLTPCKEPTSGSSYIYSQSAYPGGRNTVSAILKTSTSQDRRT